MKNIFLVFLFLSYLVINGQTVLLNQSNLQGTLDVSMCENLTELNVSQNPGLTCIKVSAFQLDAINNNDPNFNWEFDSGVTLSVDCN